MCSEKLCTQVRKTFSCLTRMEHQSDQQLINVVNLIDSRNSFGHAVCVCVIDMYTLAHTHTKRRHQSVQTDID